MTATIFFSHDQDDVQYVRNIKEGIEKNADVNVYIHEEDYQFGDLLSQAMMDRIGASDMFVVLLSERSDRSPWVQQEIGYALGRGLTVAPIVLEGPDEPRTSGMLRGLRYAVYDPEDPSLFHERFRAYFEQVSPELRAEAEAIEEGIREGYSNYWGWRRVLERITEQMESNAEYAGELTDEFGRSTGRERSGVGASSRPADEMLRADPGPDLYPDLEPDLSLDLNRGRLVDDLPWLDDEDETTPDPFTTGTTMPSRRKRRRRNG